MLAMFLLGWVLGALWHLVPSLRFPLMWVGLTYAVAVTASVVSVGAFRCPRCRCRLMANPKFRSSSECAECGLPIRRGLWRISD